MLYVLEGCDGSGKTTLANFLSKVLNAEIIHCSQDTPNDSKFFKQIIHASAERNIIADRFCYGQFIYQDEDDRPLRGERYDSYAGLADLECEMLDYGVKVIYVDAPVNVIFDRLIARGESLINGLTIEDIKDRYEDLQHISMLKWIEYDTGGTLNA